MDSEQKYTGEIYNFYMSAFFAIQIAELDRVHSDEILSAIDNVIDKLPLTSDYTHEVYGVLKDVNEFYCIEYDFEYDNDYPLIYSLNFVDSDEYLDAILNKNTIEYYGKKLTGN